MEREAADSGPRISGQLVVARFEYLRDAYGAAGVTQVLEALSEEDARLLADCARERWYPFGLLSRLDDAIASRLAPGEAEVFERLGWASARHRTEWLGEHAALVSVHAFLSRLADEHGRFHDFGRAGYRRTGFQQGELSFSEYPEAYPNFCRSARGYLLGVLQLLTGKLGQVEERTCQCRGEPACLYELRWQRDPR